MFINLPPSGAKMTYPIIGAYRIEDGRIAENWQVFRALGLWNALSPDIAELIQEATM